VTAALRRVVDPAGRVLRALELLCDAAQRSAAQLYLSQDTGLVRAAAIGMPADPPPELDEFAARHWALQLQGEMDTDVVPTGADAGVRVAETWTDAAGTSYRVLLLKSAVAGSLLYVGLVLLVADEQFECPIQYWELSSAVSTRLYELGDAQGVIVN
jgi:DNA-binding transcriptional LysR family regulator